MAPATNQNRPTPRRSRRIWQRNGIPSPTTAGGILLRLLREIRDMIYALLISSGDLSILRVSRMINAEAQFAFHQAGVSRQMAGLVQHYINGPYRALGYYMTIQNFELQCNLYSRLANGSSASFSSSVVGGMQTPWSTSQLDFRPASDFGWPDICRNQMVIKLDFGPRSSSASSTEAEQWIRRLLEGARKFIGFKFLVVEATRTPRSWTMDDNTRIGALVNSILEPELGPARGDDIGRIEYRPWSVVACQQHTSQLVPSRYDVSHRWLPPYKWFKIDSEREADAIWTEEE